MNEQQCKRLIRQDVEEAQTRCEMLLQDFDGTDLIDIDTEIDRIVRGLTDVKLRLRDCEDY